MQHRAQSFCELVATCQYGMLNGMWLPTPSDESVQKLQELLRLELNLDLEYDRARVVATRLLHLHFYKAYGSRYLRTKINGE